MTIAPPPSTPARRFSPEGIISRAGMPSGRAVAWMIGLTLVGYPVFGLLAVGMGLESRVISVLFRLIVVALSLLIVMRFVAARGYFRLNLLILLFWGMYAVRLLFDVGERPTETVGVDAMFFIGVVVIPVSAIMVVGHRFDEHAAATILFGLGLLVSVISLMLNRLGLAESENLTLVTGRLSYVTVNPITIGHAAGSTVIAALSLWPRARSVQIRGVLVAGVILSLIVLVLAGSRGPLLSVVLATMSYLVLRGRWGVLAAGTLGLLFLIPSLLAAKGVTLIDRLEGMNRDFSVLQRFDIQANAIDQFLDHPVFGSAYVELVSGYSPHNLFIETLMALGIVGIVVYIWIVVRAGSQAWKQLVSGDTLLPLLFVQYFVNAQLSDSLWGGAAFWSVMVLLGSRPILAKKTAVHSARVRS